MCIHAKRTELHIANVHTTDTQTDACKLQQPGANVSHLLLKMDANASVNLVPTCANV